jgi:hypothetical protein
MLPQFEALHVFLCATPKEKTQAVAWVLLIDLWELTGSNRRPSACKADALNQLS